MMQEITLDQAKGKTIKGYEFSCTTHQAVIVFEDGTFTTLGIYRGYEIGDEEIEESRLDLFNFGDDKLVSVGIISQKEIENRRGERDRAAAERMERAERARYEALKKRFGEG